MLTTQPPGTPGRWVQYMMISCCAIPDALGKPSAHLQKRCVQKSCRAAPRMPSRGALPPQPAAAATPAPARPGPQSGAACAPGRGRPGRAAPPPSAGPCPAAWAPAPAPSAAAAARAAPGAGGAGGWWPARVVAAPQPRLGGLGLPAAWLPAAAPAAGGPPRDWQPVARAARQAGPPGAQTVAGTGPVPLGSGRGPAGAPARCAGAPGRLPGRQAVLQPQRCSSQAADGVQASGPHSPSQRVPGTQAAPVAAAAAAAAASASAAAACWQQLRLQPHQQAAAAAQPWPLQAALLWPVGQRLAACSPGRATFCPLRAGGRPAPRVRPALPLPPHASARTPAGRERPRPEHPPPVPCRWIRPRQPSLRPELRAWLPVLGERSAQCQRGLRAGQHQPGGCVVGPPQRQLAQRLHCALAAVCGWRALLGPRPSLQAATKPC